MYASMGNLNFKGITNARISSRIRQVVVLVIAILIGIIISVSAGAQSRYKKNNTRFYKAHYKKQITLYANACTLLEKKRTQTPKTSPRLANYRKPKHKAMAEIDPPGTRLASNQQQVKVKSVAIAQVKSTPSKTELDKLHNTEDIVLAKNNLPKPSSEKHERLRNQVNDDLKNKKDNEPIELSPLFFNFDQDEFSVVDMDPFLIAVEYALQGRTILIEGHTDNSGNDNYNVQLSIKRVQKIRELMHDMGVPDERISVIGYGEEVAKHDNTSEQGREMNRRVDFKAF